MECMRCGKKTEGKNVFCPECLAEMEMYPVKPGTVIQIPSRRAPEPRKHKRKRERPVEEQLAAMHHLIQTMTVCILGLVGALLIVGFMLFYTLFQPQEMPDTPVARNYTTSATSEGD